MELFYSNKKTEKICTDLKAAKKTLEERLAVKLHKTITFLEAAKNLNDVKNHRPFHFHSLQGKRKEQFSISFAGKKSGFRLVIEPCDANGIQIHDYRIDIMAITTMAIIIREVSNHYE